MWWRFFFFFFKQKTAYEIRKGDWSSDVCSSDLTRAPARDGGAARCRRLGASARRLRGLAARGQPRPRAVGGRGGDGGRGGGAARHRVQGRAPVRPGTPGARGRVGRRGTRGWPVRRCRRE